MLEVTDEDDRPAHVVAAEILDAEIDQDAEWLRQASGDADYGFFGLRWSGRSGR
jgi:hypothetical protein